MAMQKKLNDQQEDTRQMTYSNDSSPIQLITKEERQMKDFYQVIQKLVVYVEKFVKVMEDLKVIKVHVEQ